MSVYIPIARRYRPKKFSEVIGQDITIKIITQALEQNRLGSAILFNGTRGVGKTTIARILAKVVRCENSNIDACGKCKPCTEFDTNNIDIIEIDAASHTSVDDIRDIIDSCKYLPSSGQFKVFIIDEVHMLSKSAFNALLKTLEEPPAHVKFIFATTELYKVPDTIVSRCLRFDLKRVDADLLAQYIASVCAKEGVKFEESALHLIAKAANGSVRDSLSILEQAINISDSEIKESVVMEMLCGISYSSTLKLLKEILSSDTKRAVLSVRQFLLGGASASEIMNSLMSLVHKLTCIRVGANYFGDCVLPHDDEVGLVALANESPMSRLSTLWQMLLRGNSEINETDNQKIALEMLVIRLCCASSIPDISNIISSYLQNKNPEAGTASAPKTLAQEALEMFKGSTSSLA